jgi:hypothetical protein
MNDRGLARPETLIQRVEQAAADPRESDFLIELIRIVVFPTECHDDFRPLRPVLKHGGQGILQRIAVAQKRD